MDNLHCFRNITKHLKSYQMRKYHIEIVKKFEKLIAYRITSNHQLGSKILGKKRTLTPHIFRYLDEKGNTRFDFLVDQINKKTGVSKEKIKFRIKKLASKGELLIKYNIVSRIFSSKRTRD